MAFKDLFKRPGSDWRNVKVTISHPDGEVVAGARVEINAQNGIDNYVATTDDFGVATFPTFHKRVYLATVRIYKPGVITKVVTKNFYGINESLIVVDREQLPPVDHNVPRPKAQISGKGYSDYSSLTYPGCKPAEFANIIQSLGCSFTRAWLIDAWAVDDGTHYTYKGYLPFQRDGNSWDLHKWNNDYFERLRTYTDVMNKNGIVPQFTVLELYAWSDRKKGMLWVPDASRGPFQNNINGIKWGDDKTFEILPDKWLREFISRVVKTLEGTSVVFEIGNEFPEKPLHYRVRDLIRSYGFNGPITVNRQEDTPGQYVNMKINKDFSGISFHGKKSINYLDEKFDREPEYKTFRQFWDRGQYHAPSITFSSDGCRSRSDSIPKTYDYDALYKVAKDCRVRGFNYEHQSVLKMRRFLEGTYNLMDYQYDRDFMLGLI